MEVINLTGFSPNTWSNVYPNPWRAYYGDGAEVTVSYNTHVCPNLPVPQGVHESLIHNIQRLASQRNDVQENYVVEDIVDPDLYPRIIPSTDRVIMPEPCLNDMTKNTLINSACRGSYCWIPTDVEVTGPTSVRFTSPIHNLPRTRRNEPMYQSLETVLGEMLPGMMAVLQQTTEGQPPSPSPLKTFQVVVKVQRYRVPAGATYSGQWHTEGVTEDVTAVGVYYAEWPSELSGGELKFRITELPNDNDRNRMGRLDGLKGPQGLSICVPMTQGGAITFSNNIPHRFKRLKNETKTTLHRAFVNFFV
eukprot:PhF_6_TR897/c0_g4_i5/m.1428